MRASLSAITCSAPTANLASPTFFCSFLFFLFALFLLFLRNHIHLRSFPRRLLPLSFTCFLHHGDARFSTFCPHKPPKPPKPASQAASVCALNRFPSHPSGRPSITPGARTIRGSFFQTSANNSFLHQQIHSAWLILRSHPTAHPSITYISTTYIPILLRFFFAMDVS